jgi:hypothetical protein
VLRAACKLLSFPGGSISLVSFWENLGNDGRSKNSKNFRLLLENFEKFWEVKNFNKILGEKSAAEFVNALGEISTKLPEAKPFLQVYQIFFFFFFLIFILFIMNSQGISTKSDFFSFPLWATSPRKKTGR